MSTDGATPLHPLQPELDGHIEGLWLAALADAAVIPGEAILYTLPGSHSSVEHFSAVTWRSGRVDSARDPEVVLILDQLNHIGALRATRIAVWTDRSAAGLTALIRHELEHANQFSIHPQLHDLHHIAESIVRLAPDGANQYQLIPTEMHANHAASLFVRLYFGHEVADDLVAHKDQDSAALRKYNCRLSTEHLAGEMLRFFADRSALCEAWAGTRADFRRRLNSAWRNAGSAWEGALNGGTVN